MGQSDNPPEFVQTLQRVLKETSGLLVPPTLASAPRFPPLTLVTGVPISLEDLWPAVAGGEVSDAAVDEGHARYMRGIRDLFDKNKAFVPGNHANAVLEI